MRPANRLLVANGKSESRAFSGIWPAELELKQPKLAKDASLAIENVKSEIISRMDTLKLRI